MEGSASSEQPTQGPISDKGAAGLLPRGPLWRGLVQGYGTPVVTSPGSPRSIWNPALKPKALLAGVQLPSPSFLDTHSSWRQSLPSSSPPAWSFSSHALSPGQLFIISFSKVFLRHGSYERCYTE